MNVVELRVRGSSDPATLAVVRRRLSLVPGVCDVHPTPWLDTIAVSYLGDRRAVTAWTRALAAAGYEVEPTAEGWPYEREPDTAA